MKIADNISWKTLQDKVVAVNVTTGVYYTMNSVASEIWQALGEGRQEAEILETLKKDYADIDEQELASDLKEQIAEWEGEKLIEI